MYVVSAGYGADQGGPQARGNHIQGHHTPSHRGPAQMRAAGRRWVLPPPPSTHSSWLSTSYYKPAGAEPAVYLPCAEFTTFQVDKSVNSGKVWCLHRKATLEPASSSLIRAHERHLRKAGPLRALSAYARDKNLLKLVSSSCLRVITHSSSIQGRGCGAAEVGQAVVRGRRCRPTLTQLPCSQCSNRSLQQPSPAVCIITTCTSSAGCTQPQLLPPRLHTQSKTG